MSEDSSLEEERRSSDVLNDGDERNSSDVLNDGDERNSTTRSLFVEYTEEEHALLARVQAAVRRSRNHEADGGDSSEYESATEEIEIVEEIEVLVTDEEDGEEKEEVEEVSTEALEKAREDLNKAGREMEELWNSLERLKKVEIFREGLSVVMIGMKTPALENKCASIVKYNENNKTVTLKCDFSAEFEVDESCVCSTTHEDKSEEDTNKEKTIALEPGNVYVGSICIPGITTSTQRAPYSLSILSSDMYRHTAYGDTQFCHVRSKVSSSDVVVEYVDAETQCRITRVVKMKNNSISLSGNVSQLKHPIGLEAEGEAVFRFEESKITHTLDLRLNLLSNHERYKAISLSLRRARLNFLRKLDEWTDCVERYCDCYAAELRSGILSRMTKPRDIPFMPWEHIYKASCVRCEELCSIIRSEAEKVAELTFPTQKHKDEFVGALSSRSWNRGQVHAKIDSRVRFMVKIGRLFKTFARTNHADRNYIMMNECLQKQVRLNACYNYYDRALKIAQRRIPDEVFISWRETPDKETEDGDCIICMQSFKEKDDDDDDDDDGNRIMCLPCKHRYHERCLRGWLQDHSSCPTCRFDLSSS